MLKTLITKLAESRKGGIWVGGDNRAGRNRSELDGRKTGNNKVDDGVDDEIEKKD